MPDDIDTSGLDNLQRAMSQLTGPLLDKFKSRATYYVAVALKGVMNKAPAGHHTPVIWPSEKARRYYFAMRRKAGLDPRYKRESDPMSQQIQKSWAISRAPESATLGNRATYAPYVQSSQYQTEQHATTGWMTDEQAAEKVVSDGTVGRIVEAHINAIVKEAFRGL